MARQLRSFGSCLIVCLLLVPSVAGAQEREPGIFGHAIKMAILDPSTYAPAIVTYDGTMRDWQSSQPFFQRGYVEQNARFTRSGRSGDVAISYGAGRDQILRDSLSVLAVSAVHNFGTQLIEQGLRERYPQHRKLITVFGWIERSAVASAMTYGLASPHYRQWRANQQLAAKMGIQ
jgi:hypothetical protein